MDETREVFEMVTKQTEPDLGSWQDQERRQRKRAQIRKTGAFAVVAAVVAAGGAAFALMNDDPTTSVADQPTPSASTTGTVNTTPIYTSGFLGYIDLTTGETTMTQIIPDTSAIDVSPDGTRITYTDNGVVNVADLDGSNAQALTQIRTPDGPTGPQWSPDGSSIVYQGNRVGSSIGNLYVVDVGSGQVRQITDTEGVETDNLYYMSPTFDPTGSTILFNMPTVEGGQERYDLWSVPATGGEPTLVRRGAIFGDYSPDGSQIAFIGSREGLFDDLWVAPAAGGDAQKLATGEIAIPRWSPDGTRILYNGGSGGVYVVDVATGEQTLVVESDHVPAWVDDDTLSLSP
jgi:Tol biopolymer transport system component